MMNPNLEVVMLNGRQLHEIIDIHALGPLGQQHLRRGIGGTAILMGSLRRPESRIWKSVLIAMLRIGFIHYPGNQSSPLT